MRKQVLVCPDSVLLILINWVCILKWILSFLWRGVQHTVGVLKCTIYIRFACFVLKDFGGTSGATCATCLGSSDPVTERRGSVVLAGDCWPADKEAGTQSSTLNTRQHRNKQITYTQTKEWQTYQKLSNSKKKYNCYKAIDKCRWPSNRFMRTFF